METRSITQIKAFMLYLNPMPANCEKVNLVAIAYEEGKLKQWYRDQFAEKPYQDDRWHKTFKKEGPLEWYNPLHEDKDDFSPSFEAHFEEVWTTFEAIDNYLDNAKASFGFIAIPTIIT